MHYAVIHRRFSTSTISSAPSKLVVPHSLCGAGTSKRLPTFMMTARALLLILAFDVVKSFNVVPHAPSSSFALRADLATVSVTDENKQSGGNDISTAFVNALINSPLYTPIVSMAKSTMIKTAATVGIDWKGKAKSLRLANPNWDSLIDEIKSQRDPSFAAPSYYVAPFHGYKDGNLCMDAALEQEIAGIN